LLPAKLLQDAAARGAVACRGATAGVRRSARRDRRPSDCRLLRRIVLLWLQCTPLMAPTAGPCDLLAGQQQPRIQSVASQVGGWGVPENSSSCSNPGGRNRHRHELYGNIYLSWM
jgi:hypothetical protein